MNRLLLPHKYKKAGWIILIPAAIIGIFLIITDYQYLQINATSFAVYSDGFFGENNSFRFVNTNITNTLIGTLFIIGALMVGFSKEKNEDEYIASLRLSSLLWAVLINYSLLLFAFVFIYGMAFINVMFYNMFTVLTIFIVRFNFMLFRNTQMMTDEKYN